MRCALPDRLLTARDLQERGWTPGLISQCLGSADASAPNPHVTSAAPMRLFASERVLCVEQQPEFQAAQTAAQSRRVQAKARAQRSAEALVEIARTVPLRLPNPGIDPQTTPDRDRDQLAALLEHLSPAEWVLDAAFGLPGVRAARVELRRRMLVLVMESYPHLATVALERARNLKGNVNETV